MRFLFAFSALALSVSMNAYAQAPKPNPVKTSGTPAVRTVDITATDDMKYDRTTIEARPGEQLRIRLTVRGVIPKIAMAHNVVVLKAGTDPLKFVEAGAPFRGSDFVAPTLQNAVIAKTALAGPGETVQVTFTVPAKPGRYPYLCTFSGHYQAGARGMLIVR
jgi:azurin